jgi:two-component system, chemotaxis family, CheB/CheR fusion protein
MISAPIEHSAVPASALRIVGVGASAGGLTALEQFFGSTSPTGGLAYVVVQHLDPTQKALLPALLQRVTSMRVRQAEELTRVEPDCVYVIPPNTELSVVDGTLNVEEPGEPRGLRLPINVLFSSLARDQRERAIAVVLSGMGSDGTLGMQAVKALGGLTLVQQPDTAQFDSMPRSAISAGCADIVAPPAELPARILEYLAQVAIGVLPQSDGRSADSSADSDSVRAILALLQHRTRHDFSLYKPNTLLRRIERRMAIHSLGTLKNYADFLSKNSQEIDLLFKELLIGVTSFFRDTMVWEHLTEFTLPELLARRADAPKLRAWVIGCSTGEEAYSLAMAYDEVTRRLPEHPSHGMQIFASDLSPDAIAVARRGQYPASIATDVPPERLARFFSPTPDGQYQISQSIRDMVLFAHHDVLLDPPFTKLDLISCRNLMIYFDAELQRKLLPLFHYSLRAGGILVLGSSETVGRFDRLFLPIEPKLRLYLRQDHVARSGDFLKQSFPPLSDRHTKEPKVPAPTITAPADNLQAAADHVLLQTYAPPAVVVNDTGDVVYISGRTGKYLEPAAGKSNWNFYAMAREELRTPLADALKKAVTQSAAITLGGLQLQMPGGVQLVDVTVQALREPGVLHGMVMIVFRDVAPGPAPRGRRRPPSVLEASHAAELQQHRDEIQSLRDAMRASKEELQSSNEELQSTNEELQSANEELTSSKEEMQSMNEELQTVNSEMQTKLDDLSLAQSDMKNLLNSTDIAMLFLDQDLNVRRYTDRASKIINLREIDIGRPLSDLTTSLQYPTLQDDARETLHTLKFSEKQILAGGGRWFSVRIMPYRRLDNVIDGAVITFVDITATKELESRLRLDAKP